MMHRFLLASALAIGLTVLACDEGTGPTGPGSISLRIVTPEDAGEAHGAAGRSAKDVPPRFHAMGHLTGARVFVSGPTTKEQDLSQSGSGFSGTVDGLAPGRYSVTVVGLVDTEVDHFGRTTGVEVQAGRNTTASITFASFRPALDALPASSTRLTFRVTWPAIAAATGYHVEWSRTSDFASVESQDVTTNQADITVPDLGDVFVRASASNAAIDDGRVSDPISTHITTDITPSGDDLGTAPNLGFGDAANGRLTDLNIFAEDDVDVFRVDGCFDDQLRVEVFAARLDPPAALDPFLVVFDAALNVIASNDDIEPGNLDSRVDVTLPANGDYYPTVAAHNLASVGAYELEIELTPGPNNQGTFCAQSDLAPTAATSASPAYVGELTWVDLTIDNFGNGNAPGIWTGQVFLTADQIINETMDYELIAWFEDQTAPPGGQITRRLVAQVPAGVPAGAYHLGVLVDVHNDVGESDESNNVFVTSATIDVVVPTLAPSGTIGAGLHHSCWVTETQTLECWGNGLNGQLGDGTPSVTSLPVTVSGGEDFHQVGPGLFHACGLTTSGHVFCWGANGSGQLGDGTFEDSPTPVFVGADVLFTKLAVGANHSCALAAGGEVYCWGSGGAGELGDGTFTRSNVPVAVPGFTFEDVAAGDFFTCAIETGGAAHCWGNGTQGQIGNGAHDDVGTPTAVSGGFTFGTISAGRDHACGVTTGGAAYCWGGAGSGQLGDGTFGGGMGTSNVPVAVAGPPASWLAVTAGNLFSCGIAGDQSVWCWGNNFYGQLGNGNTDPSFPSQGAPVQVLGSFFTVRALATGGFHACAVTTGGVPQCWGRNHFGAVGDGAALDHTSPRALAASLDFFGVDGGGFHSCGIESDGSQSCWGSNWFGALGDGSGADSPTPVSVFGSIVAVSGATDYFHTCGVATDGTGHCFGDNSDGQLGDGTNMMAATPVGVAAPPSGFSVVDAGYFHTCGIGTDGTTYCWGWNGFGQLGNGGTSAANVPTALTGSFAQITAGLYHTCALDGSGAAYCWGLNADGQLGDGTTSDKLTPTAVSGGLAFDMIQAGGFHTCGITTDGRTFCWGFNGIGELGLGDNSSRSQPTELSGRADVYLSLGIDHTCGLEADGSVECTGWNFYGQLGDGTFDNRNTMAAIAGGATFASIGAGTYHTCGVATDGTDYCWGRNNRGQLGNGTTTIRTEPVSVVTAPPAFAAGMRRTRIMSYAPHAGADFIRGADVDRRGPPQPHR